MLRAVQFEQPDAMIFCGDGAKDFKAVCAKYPVIPAYAVKGNCDHASGYPERLTVTLGEKKIFITHGHLFRAKFLYDPMIYAAEEAQADLLCFGHTHAPHKDSVRGLNVLNPGAVMNNRYATVEITGYGLLISKLLKI
jgi:putative phosphoesterase